MSAVTEASVLRLKLVYDELTDEWQTTQEIAKKLGVEWRPGSAGDLAEVRLDLYRLVLRGEAKQFPTHNGHRWRRAQ